LSQSPVARDDRVPAADAGLDGWLIDRLFGRR
jgi:hypothetical protein